MQEKEEIRARLIQLHAILADNWRIIRDIYHMDKTFQSVYEMPPNELQQTFRLSSEKANYLYEHLQSKETLSYEQITTLTIFDEEYPSLLKEIHDPPWVLYAIGNTKLLQTNMLSIVGTRYPTNYAFESMKLIMKELPQKMFTIVSGLALGIDTYAHQLAMEYQHGTIAVIGSGFYHLYPAQNKSLAEKISQSNLLLTEYPPSYSPRKWYFPKRNRIISGLSLGTVVVEAKEKSGSLITADSAIEQGREVFAIPGSIVSAYSKGTNQLIQQGAKLITSTEDILEELQFG